MEGFMNDERAEILLGQITQKIRDNVSSGVLLFAKKGLAGQSELAVYDAIQELVNEDLLNCENVIYLQDSHQFPDIVIKFANGYSLGIEVKSSSSNGKGWSINGNSVLGSTSLDVTNIYIIFIKFNDSTGFDLRYASYQDSVVDVVVTHSPRYKIDLDIDLKESPSKNFFNRSGISYEDLKKSDNPISIITDHFRKEGKVAWWLGDNSGEKATSATIMSWNDLDPEIADEIYGEAIVLFPEIINGEPRTKYKNLAKWLAAKHSIIDSSLRDKFSAGGRIPKLTHLGLFSIKDAPQVYGKITCKIASIERAFIHLDKAELQSFWPNYNPIDSEDTPMFRKKYWYNRLSLTECDEKLHYLQSLLEIDLPQVLQAHCDVISQ